MRTFKIPRAPFGDEKIYAKSKVTFEPGVTVLVGCNGVGKTTMLRLIERELKNAELPCLYYDNLTEGGQNARSKAAFYEDFNFVGLSMCSSEGENIIMNMERVASSMGRFSMLYKDEEELWFLFDAIDSGLSIDNVLDIKEYLFKTVLEHNEDKKIYILVSANEYEMANGEKCFDVQRCQYVNIKTYNAFKKLVLKTKERKKAIYEESKNKRESLRNRRPSGLHRDC